MTRVSVLAACAGVATAAVLSIAGPASATDYNVAATQTAANPTMVTLTPGQYSLTAIGAGDGGGLYNGWNTNSQPGCLQNCGNQWQWGYAYFSAANIITLIGVTGQFGTDLAALQAVQASPTFNFNTFNIQTSVFTPGSVPNPFVFTIDQTTTFGVFIADGDGDSTHNLGGVSFRLAAVPEPATWAMMIAGFGLAGAAMRRRRALATA